MMETDARDTITNWIQIARDEHHALFSELDALLKALDRFFITDNLPASKYAISSRDMRFELETAKDGIVRVLAILETIIPETNRNAYWFQKFAKDKLMDNRKRDRMRAGMYRQDSPEKSLYVLFDTFINLKSLAQDILRNNDIMFMSFKNLGEIISKEIRENQYFNPFSREVNPDFDFISNEQITRIVRNIDKKETKKAVSILFLHMFRLLRYLKTMDHRSLNMGAIHCSLLIFSLLKAEIDAFRSYIERFVPKTGDTELEMLAQSLSYQIGMESKRVYQQELKDIGERKNTVQMRGRIEASRGILKNLVEHATIQLARHWHSDLTGDEVFDVFITKTAQSMKLREDTYVLNRLVSESVKADDSIRPGVFSMLMNYMEYFENFTFKLLRYSDYEHFSNLFNTIRDGYQAGENIKKLMDTCHQFNIFLDTTLSQISQRADLKGRPLDVDKAEDIVKQYLSSIT
jgi:hypothetical protein